MSVEENKAIVKRWNEELINKGNLDIIDELGDVNYVIHPSGRDRAAFRQSAAEMDASFSESSIAIEDTIAEGDKVAIRWTLRWTHTGEYMGIPATGKQVTITGTSIYRVANGKIVEDWANVDMLGMMQQLGAIPSMGGGGD
jgi:steroid delta-isomerase-like uncharacterized protein